MREGHIERATRLSGKGDLREDERPGEHGRGAVLVIRDELTHDGNHLVRSLGGGQVGSTRGRVDEEEEIGADGDPESEEERLAMIRGRVRSQLDATEGHVQRGQNVHR